MKNGLGKGYVWIIKLANRRTKRGVPHSSLPSHPNVHSPSFWSLSPSKTVLISRFRHCHEEPLAFCTGLSYGQHIRSLIPTLSSLRTSDPHQSSIKRRALQLYSSFYFLVVLSSVISTPGSGALALSPPLLPESYCQMYKYTMT